MSVENNDPLAEDQSLAAPESKAVQAGATAESSSGQLDTADFFSNLPQSKSWQKTLKIRKEAINEFTETMDLAIEFNRTQARKRELGKIIKIDSLKRDAQLHAAEHNLKLLQQNGEHELVENDLVHKVRVSEYRTQLTEQEVKRAGLVVQRDAILNPEKRPEKEPRSVADNLRLAVARGIESEDARFEILAEEQKRCDGMVERGEISLEDGEHRMALVREKISQYFARKS